MTPRELRSVLVGTVFDHATEHAEIVQLISAVTVGVEGDREAEFVNQRP